MSVPQQPPDRVPAFARPLVILVVCVMTAAAIFVWEPWPFTSFRLFSHVRTDEQGAWVARTVDAEGEEAAYPLGALDLGLRGFTFAMAEFVTASDERQDELCRTWVEVAPEAIGTEARAVLIYRRTWRLSEREGERAQPGTMALAYECDRRGVVRDG